MGNIIRRRCTEEDCMDICDKKILEIRKLIFPYIEKSELSDKEKEVVRAYFTKLFNELFERINKKNIGALSLTPASSPSSSMLFGSKRKRKRTPKRTRKHKRSRVKRVY
jgi:hypothetical protein